MKRFCTLSILAAAAIAALAQNSGNPFVGRWDITQTVGNAHFASWLEVTENPLAARAQQATGNVAPVAGVKMEGQKLIVTVTAAAPARPETIWEFTAQGGKLTGIQKSGDKTRQLTGVRAPPLQAAAVKSWAPPEELFNGKDLSGWEPINNTPEFLETPGTSHWTVKNGELTNEAKGSNLRTKKTFNDFKLHVEYACPPGENSGIYLRGRYEVQVGPPPAARPAGVPALPKAPAAAPTGYRNPFGGVGSIYGMLGPATPPPFQPEWQTYDITLIGRMATVVFNGVTTIDNKEIAGVTGGALDSNEAEPGPIYLQGDHHGGIRYRKITLTAAKH
jgi:hypothetical protein